MKLYFIVEGETEAALYPFWLPLLVPTLQQSFTIDNSSGNSFYLVSGYGYPAMASNNHIANAIKEINQNGTFDYFVICLDADRLGVAKRRAAITEYLAANNLTLTGKCQLVLIVHDPCVETWLLATRKYYPAAMVNANFVPHQNHYNVATNDPELMPPHPAFKLPVSRYHSVHLIEMLKPKIRYTKSNPRGVMTSEYFQDILLRSAEETTHITSFKAFLDFCDTLNRQL